MTSIISLISLLSVLIPSSCNVFYLWLLLVFSLALRFERFGFMYEPCPEFLESVNSLIKLIWGILALYFFKYAIWLYLYSLLLGCPITSIRPFDYLPQFLALLSPFIILLSLFLVFPMTLYSTSLILSSTVSSILLNPSIKFFLSPI